MEDIGISPNDPSFYNHHTFLDHLWEQFRQTKQNPSQRESNYPSNDQSCNNFHYADSTMRPFTIRNKDGLSNTYTRELFHYQPRPSCSAQSCGSQYLFCDTRNNRCLSKVKPGGLCTGFDGTPICYGNGICRNGRCYIDDTPQTVGPVETSTQRTRPTPTSRVTTRPTRPSPTQSTTTQSPWTYEPEPTYGPPPPPPPPTDMPYAIPNYPIVWFTCTVQRGTGPNGGPPVYDATVRTVGTNIPQGYYDVLPGKVMTDNRYPSYNGAAVMQIRDPKSTGYMSMVEFRIEAFDRSGRQCGLKCYSSTRRQYVNCNSNKFKVSTNSYYSDPIKTDQSQLTALESQWTEQLTRQPDYCLIQCP